MLARVQSGAVLGIDPFPLAVEVDIHSGMNGINIVGLPDAAVKESKDRVGSAIKNSGYRFPRGVVVINLAPADVKKEGSSLDLPIALGWAFRVFRDGLCPSCNGSRAPDR